MCGPLILALPARVGGLRAHLLYHLGRICTYTLTGALLGAAGGLATEAGELAGLARTQTALSVFSGVLLGLLGLNRLGLLPGAAWLVTPPVHKVPGQRSLMVRIQPGSDSLALLPLGLILGLLPCGLSYGAFARALSSGGAASGALMAFTFGCGTLPALLLLGTAAARPLRRHRRAFELLSGMILVGMAVALLSEALFRVGA